ncbi:MAG: tRNA dihydrouridine synthase DusB [Lachnospiraceae bacterium]|nr:tRNA dihydrouridine synthase DusB [Lachnospiraceae bacterium]
MIIGNVSLKNNIILAPMAGVSDLPFRLLCQKEGAGMTCMEMISAKAVLYNNKNTESLLAIHPDEECVSLQLFGSEPAIMAEIAKRIEERPFKILDINMGCPVPKIVNNQEGSALMKNPELVYDIVRAISEAISKPVTVKIRKGFDEDHVNAVEVARAAEAGGAKAVAVHGRTREQYYSGAADWSIIKAVKEAVHIPVIGNGDIKCGADAKRMLEETGCDGVMVGRAAEGNPFIFREITAFMEGREYTAPTLKEIKETVLLHADMQLEYKGEFIGIREMRKHLSWYLKGFEGASALRKRINEMETFEELKEIINNIYA